MKMNINMILQEIIDQYKLNNIVDYKGWIYMKICKCMYGLKQAGVIAHNKLAQHLKLYGYHPVTFTSGLWKHQDLDTIFSLVVDDFSIKYTSDKISTIFLTL